MSTSSPKIVFLEMSPDGPNEHHIEILKNNDKCDFFYVTFKKPVENDDSFLGFFPNTVWGETRQKLFELVPKKYDYYCFIDDDIILKSCTANSFIEQLLIDINTIEPVVMAPYYTNEQTNGNCPVYKMKNDNGYAMKYFSNCAFKAYHKDYLNYFFPIDMKYGGQYASAFFLGLLELIFKNKIITSHNITYTNPPEQLADYSNAKTHENNAWNEYKTYFNMNLNNINKSSFITHYVNNNYKVLTTDIYKQCIEIDFSSVYKNNNIFYDRYINNIHRNETLKELNVFNKYKPRCVILLYGLMRSFKKTSDNFFKNIIENNMNNYDFDIFVCTQNENKSNNYDYTKYNYKYDSEEDMKKDIMKYYNKYNQLKDISILNLTKGFFSNSHRLNKLIDIIGINNTYDRIIYIRPDITINKKINIDEYKNKFSVMPSIYKHSPQCFFHDRDWDFLWIGDNKSFKLWSYPYLKCKRYDNDVKFDIEKCNLKFDKTIFDNNLLNDTDFQIMNKKYKLNGNVEFNKNSDIMNVWHFYIKIITHMEASNVTFSFNENIYTDIVR
jgi:hypothetical protein